MIFGGPLPKVIRFQEIDESTRGDHSRLALDDNCLYLYEYTSGGGFKDNQLISNLKKKPSERTTKGGYHYKAAAIRECSDAFRLALNPKWLLEATLVPVPGSKVLGDPDYDDRMEQVCRGIGPNVDVRNLVTQTQSTIRSHEVGQGGRRPTVDELLAIYKINEALALPGTQQIGIFDDILTNGTHFKAMKAILAERFPNVTITGIFVARVKRPNKIELFTDL
jgi:hypothetical protein